MSSLFQSLKEKAQSAVNSSGITGGRTEGRVSPTGAQASGNGGGFAGITKSHTFESIHHQLRSFQQQYSSSTTPVQKIITSAKGVALDYEAVARDVQAHSKELYLWGQTDAEDIKDVTDREGWLSYVHGTLASELAAKLDAARAPFKELRNAENALAPRRNIRNGLQTQISRLEYDQYDQRGNKEKQQRLADLKVQLQKAEAEDVEAEREIEILKRKAVRESEQLKWEAVREYAEKLSMVAQAGTSIAPVLPPLPPSPAQPYNGGQATASVRASLQKALENYTTGNVNLIVASPSDSDLKHTRSFGVTHAQELSRIGSPGEGSNIQTTPPLSGSAALPPTYPNPQHSPPPPQPATSPSSSLGRPVPMPMPVPAPHAASPYATAPSPSNVSPPLDPTLLNQAPAPIPSPHVSAAPVVAPNPADPAAKVLAATPTVAETGVPRSAGPEGPGPLSGSLLDKKPSSQATYESATDEKKRLEREERERVLQGEGGSPSRGAGSSAPKYESAEEEKKRLEREERERVLRQGGSGGQPPRGHEDDPDHDLPPYQEF